LARYAVRGQFADLPIPVRKEATRTLLNWVACALGGSQNEAVPIAISALAPFFGRPQAAILGRKERADILNAALINGISAHVLDFDDTHMATAIHPGASVVPAIMALAEYKPVSGRDFLNALVLGIEVECRIGAAVYPAHYEAGWHITGTTGVFGAAAAAGRLLNLSEQQMKWALGLAAAQPVGFREMFGSMTKSFHPGRAAHNGLTAALLASRNYTSSEQGIEAKSGWANVVSTEHDYKDIQTQLGKTYLLSENSYKPFASGLVVHPVIDGCIQLRNEHKLMAEQIAKIDLRVHRLVLELTAKKSPRTGLEGKFSVYHAAAVAITEGAGGETQFSDSAVNKPATVTLRGKVEATVDSSLKGDQARVIIVLQDGRKLEKFVEHAVGSIQNPMSDRDLEAKFLSLADGVIPTAKARRVMEQCWNAAELKDAGAIAKAAV
jgi:2-methylcitrate dehydratase PrpD